MGATEALFDTTALRSAFEHLLQSISQEEMRLQKEREHLREDQRQVSLLAEQLKASLETSSRTQAAALARLEAENSQLHTPAPQPQPQPQHDAPAHPVPAVGAWSNEVAARDEPLSQPPTRQVPHYEGADAPSEGPGSLGTGVEDFPRKAIPIACSSGSALSAVVEAPTEGSGHSGAWARLRPDDVGNKVPVKPPPSSSPVKPVKAPPAGFQEAGKPSPPQRPGTGLPPEQMHVAMQVKAAPAKWTSPGPAEAPVPQKAPPVAAAAKPKAPVLPAAQ